MLKRLFCDHIYLVDEKIYLYSFENFRGFRERDSRDKTHDVYMFIFKCKNCGKIKHEKHSIRSG